MSIRPPKAFRQAALEDPVAAALEQEIFAEKAGTLARLNKKLEIALTRIPEDPGIAENEASRRERNLRIAEAGEALWHVTIQRELCGLTRHKAFFDHMGVPSAVRLCAGPVPDHLKPRCGAS